MWIMQEKDKESSIAQMAAIMKVNGLLVNKQGMESLLGQMAVIIKEIGKMDYDMVKEK